MAEDLIDTQQRESAVVGGEASNVLEADTQAWQFLESVMGRDPVSAWTLTKMSHGITGLGKIEWTATFERDPSVPVPPLQAREVSDDELRAAQTQDANAAQQRAAEGHGPRS